MPRSLLIKNADYLVTMDEERRILRHVSVYCEGNKIEEIATKKERADQVINGRGLIMLPGLINTHHHLFQTLFRGIDILKKQPIVPWIKTITELSRNIDEEAMYSACLTGMAELMLSGCTTTADFLYLFPFKRNNLLRATIKAASDIGIRFHQVRGYMESRACNLWPEYATQKAEEILRESQLAIDKYHNQDKFSMCQIALGPCGLYSTSKELFKQICLLARKNQVKLHTHFAEEPNDKISLLEQANCLGDDVWLAHVVYVNAKDIKILANSKTGIAHCPICNMSQKQIFNLIAMERQGIAVGIGVDGSASNDSSNLIIEGRMAGRLQGLNKNSQEVSYLRATQILEMLTLGGAACLGRSESLGSLEAGKAADIVLIKIDNKIDCAGSYNPLEAIFHTGLSKVDYTIVNGKVVVEKGIMKTIKLDKQIKKHNLISNKIVKSAEKRLGLSFIIPWTRLSDV